MRWSIFVVLAACSSSNNNSAVDGAVDSQPGNDTPGHPIDAAIDAPLLGNACPTQVTEVKRLTSALSAYPYDNEAILVGDMDHDGMQDIAVVEGQSDSTNQDLKLRVRLFLRSGATDFAAPVQSDMIFPYYGPEQILLGDFNGDHLQDILLSYTDSQSSSRTSYVYIATQQADHTFTLSSGIDVSACRSSSDERLFALGIFDIDADGDDDVLATVSFDGLGAAPAALTLMHGSSSGLGFASCANANYPADMVTAERFRTLDFDNDGKTDLLGLYYDHITLFHATGPSAFTEAATTATYDEYAHLGTAASSLVATSSSSSTMNSTAKRYAIDASGVAAGQTLATLNEDGGGFDILRGYAVGDFNGDGRTDVIEVGNHNYSDNYPDTVSFGMACDRNATWETSSGMFPNGIYSLHAIDFGGHTDAIVHEGSDYDLVIYQF
jgi:hypothetical protein